MNDEQRRLVTAYHDGELDAVGRRLAQELLASDADARRYLEALEHLQGRLRTTFDPILHAPIPLTILGVIRSERKRRLRHLFLPMGLAASLALVALLLIRQGTLDRQMQDQFLLMQEQITQLRHRTLENVPSGTVASWVAPAGQTRVEVMPVKSYRSGDNQFCREYEERVEDAQGVEIRRGIACRAGKALWPDRAAGASPGGDAAGEGSPGVAM